jgi:tRNA A-37 threonylcarbamoyl transferase component Bud32
MNEAQPIDVSEYIQGNESIIVDSIPGKLWKISKRIGENLPEHTQERVEITRELFTTQVQPILAKLKNTGTNIPQVFRVLNLPGRLALEIEKIEGVHPNDVTQTGKQYLDSWAKKLKLTDILKAYKDILMIITRGLHPDITSENMILTQDEENCAITFLDTYVPFEPDYRVMELDITESTTKFSMILLPVLIQRSHPHIDFNEVMQAIESLRDHTLASLKTRFTQ